MEKKKQNSLFIKDMIAYVDNSKGFIGKLLEWITKFSMVPGFKANMKTQLYFYESATTHRKQNFYTETLYSSSTEHQISRNKFNKRGTRSFHWKP